MQRRPASRQIPSASEYSDVENIPTRGNRTLLKDKSDRDQSIDGYDFVKGSSDMATPRPRMEIFVLLKPFRHQYWNLAIKHVLAIGLSTFRLRHFSKSLFGSWYPKL